LQIEIPQYLKSQSGQTSFNDMHKQLTIGVSASLVALFISTIPTQSAAAPAILAPANFVKFETAAKVKNTANLRDLKYKSFSYDIKKDNQIIELSWKANRGHTFEILARSNGKGPDQYFKERKGTTLKLTVPANGGLWVAVRAENNPDYGLVLQYESPLQFKYLVTNRVFGLCKDKETNAQDRIELWTVFKNKKLTARLGLFVLVAPSAINAAPGTRLSDALASTIVSTISDLRSPLDWDGLVQGLGALAESRGSSLDYFYLRCSGL
jgi:hypothetical protein